MAQIIPPSLTELLADATQVSPGTIVFAGYGGEAFAFTDTFTSTAGAPYDITSWTISNIQYANGTTDSEGTRFTTIQAWQTGGAAGNVQVTKVNPNTLGQVLIQVSGSVNTAPARTTPFSPIAGYGVLFVRFVASFTINGIPQSKNFLYAVVSTPV